MRLAWTGPSAQAHFVCTGWDTFQALLAPFALKVLLNATHKVNCLNEIVHLSKSVRHTQITLVGHLKSVLLSDLKSIAVTLIIFTLNNLLN